MTLSKTKHCKNLSLTLLFFVLLFSPIIVFSQKALLSDNETGGEEFVVTLIDNGVISVQNVASTVELPTTPSISGFKCKKEQYTFVGWTSQDAITDSISCPELVTLPFTPISDTTLYAVYSIEPDSLVFEAGTLPDGWSFNGTTTAQNEWQLKGGQYLITDKTYLPSVDSIGFNCYLNTIKEYIAYLHLYYSSNNSFNINGTKVEHKIPKGLVYSYNFFKNDTDLDSGFIKITPYFFGTTNPSNILSIKEVIFKYKDKYTFNPECTYVPTTPTAVNLYNADTLFYSGTNNDEFPFVFPTTTPVPTKGSQRVGWTFLGWSSDKFDTTSFLRPQQIVDTANFLFERDTTLYSVFARYDYKAIDINKSQKVALGAVTPKGCFVIPSNIAQIPYNAPKKITDVEKVSFFSSPLAVSNDDVEDIAWVMHKEGQICRFNNDLYQLCPGGDGGNSNFMLDNKGINAHWVLIQGSDGLLNLKTDYKDLIGSGQVNIACYNLKTNDFYITFKSIVEANDNLFPVAIIPICEDYYTSKPYNVTSLSPTDSVTIETDEDVFYTDELHLSIYQNAICQLSHNAPIEATYGTTLTAQLSGEKTKIIGLPFDCAISDIVVCDDGDTLDYLNNWYIESCIGSEAVDNVLPIQWVRDNEIDTLHSGVGYRISIVPDYGDATIMFATKVLQTYYPFDVSVECTEASVENGGWSFMSTPYLNTFGGSILEDNEMINFIVQPNADGSFVQIEMGNAVEQGIMTPYTPFFIQKRDSYSTHFAPNDEFITPEHIQMTTYISSSGGAILDSTILRTDDDAQPLYEIGSDMVKWIDTTKTQIFFSSDDIRYFVNQQNISLPFTINLGIFSPCKQDVVFKTNSYLPSSFGTVSITDNKKSHLLTDEGYTATVDSGFTEQRFALKFGNGMSTINDVNIVNDLYDEISVDENGIVVIGLNANVHLLVVDMTGKIVCEVMPQTSSSTLNIPLLVRGVYNLVFKTEQKSVSEKIVY